MTEQAHLQEPEALRMAAVVATLAHPAQHSQ